MQLLLKLVCLIVQVWIINISNLLITASYQVVARLEPQFKLIHALVQSINVSYGSFMPVIRHHKGFSGVPIYVIKDNFTGPGSVERITRTYKITGL